MNNSIVSKSDGIKVTGLSIVAFICGAAVNYKFNVVGEIYVTEVLLALTSLFVFFLGGGLSLFRRSVFLLFLLFAVLALIAYMLSDLYRGTDPSQYLRGWGRWCLFIGDLIALSMLAENHKRNLWWYALGMGIGGIMYFLIEGLPLSNWKFGYGVPITYTVACFSLFLPARFASLVILALSILSIGFDFRSLGGETLSVATVLWVRSRRSGQPILRLRQMWRLIGVTVVGGTILVAALIATRQGTEIHRDESDTGRLAGIKVALIAIRESPFIGWGSWTENEEFAKMEYKDIKSVIQKHGGEAEAGSLFSPHSQILQIWVEGGLLAAIFCFYYGYQLILSMKYIFLARLLDVYTSIFFLALIIALWDFFASPFLGYTRLSVAYAVAIICVMRAERRTALKNAKLIENPANTSALFRKSA